MRKIILLVMSVVLSVSVLTGCSGSTNANNKSNIEKSTEKTEVKETSKEVKNNEAYSPSADDTEDEDAPYYATVVKGCSIISDDGHGQVKVQSLCSGCGHMGSYYYLSTPKISGTKSGEINFCCNEMNCPMKGKTQYLQIAAR